MIFINFNLQIMHAKLFLLIGLFLVLVSCKTSNNSGKKTKDITVDVVHKSNENEKLVAQIAQLDNENSDAVNIESQRIEANTLYLEVSYGGGCKDHQFLLIGSTDLLKTLPPSRKIRLIHHANKDNCEAFIRKTLEIDISPLALKKEKGSVISLQIEGMSEPIRYEYQDGK